MKKLIALLAFLIFNLDSHEFDFSDLDWEWDNVYLSPHLNARSVSTSSSVQVRSQINSKSLGGWKHYKDMLKPAIKILTKTEKYRKISD